MRFAVGFSWFLPWAGLRGMTSQGIVVGLRRGHSGLKRNVAWACNRTEGASGPGQPGCVACLLRVMGPSGALLGLFGPFGLGKENPRKTGVSALFNGENDGGRYWS